MRLNIDPQRTQRRLFACPGGSVCVLWGKLSAALCRIAVKREIMKNSLKIQGIVVVEKGKISVDHRYLFPYLNKFFGECRLTLLGEGKQIVCDIDKEKHQQKVYSLLRPYQGQEICLCCEEA
jgi:hypothetical protein